jgi:hypothetical protein
LRERVIGAFRESRVVDPFDAVIPAQELGHLSAVFNVALDAQGDSFNALDQEEELRAGSTAPVVRRYTLRQRAI